MPLPRPRWRFRLRTLMIAVAVVAMFIGLGLWRARMRRLATEYQLRAQYHYLMEDEARVQLERAAVADPSQQVEVSEPDGKTRVSSLKEMIAQLQRDADQHARLKQKYLRAASRPWLPIPPDPPVPE